uniref:Subtilisin-like protease n=1 Tax=Kalanchoe fedtschenkoi TaxID=63787 RepID=A0A7N0TVY2_KALFE
GVKLHTTRSWEFMGLEQDGVATSQSLWKKSKYGKDAIIATLDTGVWPESESFSDKGLGPVPSRWKGACADKQIKCNKKLIGARYYNKGFDKNYGGNLTSVYRTVLDYQGHGTHTLSTAGGSFVPKASLFGNGNGTAKGGSPQARVAAYKVCWPPLNSPECVTSDILAGFEAAIGDGVDVLSMSIGGPQRDYKEDGLAIGAFHAVQHGITVVASAGNSGPDSSTVTNGKIVVCLLGGLDYGTEKGLVVQNAGGVGYILANDIDSKDAALQQTDLDFLPASHITYKDSQTLLSYINVTKNPYAYITNLKTYVGSKKRAPVMAPFSSVGPNPVDPEILKPDITAPGVRIIAAYTGLVAPSPVPQDTRRVKFSILSGTSMSCPHISGIVGLLKSLHPQWSPAAIRSAIMTTATTEDNNKKPISESTGQPATPLNYGAGHVNPNKAADPGLVYDLAEDDYLNFLCAKGYTEKDLKAIALKPYKCPKSTSLLDLNYPSIAVPRLNGSAITIPREVKNVGTPGTYTVKVEAPAGVSVKVEPASLKFDKAGEVKKFSVTLKAVGKLATEFVFGSFVWSDGKHQVRSPIVVGA